MVSMPVFGWPAEFVAVTLSTALVVAGSTLDSCSSTSGPFVSLIPLPPQDSSSRKHPIPHNIAIRCRTDASKEKRLNIAIVKLLSGQTGQFEIKARQNVNT
jgi:hypothetical protein